MGRIVIRTRAQLGPCVAGAIIITLNSKLLQNVLPNFPNEIRDTRWLVSFIVLPIVAAAGLLLFYIIFHPFLSKRSNQLRVPHAENLPLDFSMNDQFNRIAITVDFSDTDQKAISRALTTGGINTSYLLIHVVESAGAMLMEKDISDLESGTDSENLKRYAAALSAQGYKVTYELGFGRRSKVIPALVKKFNADLLVMGTHGHRGLKDVLFGETINAVRHKIGIPLLAVK